VIWVETDCNLEALVCKAQISDANSNMADVIPYFRSRVVIFELQCTLKTRQSHIVLRCIVAAQSHVVP
jgi:hypothetical protein